MRVSVGTLRFAHPTAYHRLIPAFQTWLKIAAPRPLKGALMGRHEAGRGAAPAGRVATLHPGGAGAPPGTTTGPCQELADCPATDPPVAESGARCVTQKTPRRKHALRRSRECAFFGALSLRYLSACWRAERRPPYPATDTDTKGLRFSARRPLHALRSFERREDLSCPQRRASSNTRRLRI
jgi:hypothetical protein